MVIAARSAVVGIFKNRKDAQECVHELKRLGFRDDQIGFAARGEANTIADANTPENQASEGAAVGAATGAGIGGLWALGIIAGILPAIGPAIAGGILVSILSSAAAAAAVGGVAGALIGLGIPEDEARTYEKEFRAGRTIVTVQAEAREDEVVAAMRNFSASVNTSRNSTAQSATPLMGQKPI